MLLLKSQTAPLPGFFSAELQIPTHQLLPLYVFLHVHSILHLQINTAVLTPESVLTYCVWRRGSWEDVFLGVNVYIYRTVIGKPTDTSFQQLPLQDAYKPGDVIVGNKSCFSLQEPGKSKMNAGIYPNLPGSKVG